MSTDNDESAPLKRLRTAEDPFPDTSTIGAPSDLTNLQRHERFWFDDSIVLVTRRKTGFRVYRTLLKAQSTVFADTFASSSPSADEMIEGCPVVRLSGTPEDIVHFLRVLLPKSNASEITFTFHQISAVVRLAHKYHVEDVLDKSIESLQEHFPSNFDDWTSETEGTVRLRPNHAVGVVKLVKLVYRPLLLPIAFYRCVLQNMLKLVVDDDCASDPDVLSLCHWCEKEVIARDLRARRRVWNELPDIFDLTVDGWVMSEDGGDTSGSEND